MALKTSSGEPVKKIKVDIVNNLYNEEINKKNNEDRKDTFEKAHEIITREVAELQTTRLPISSLYAAPYNEEWNKYPKVSDEKAYEMNQSIIDGGLLTPIIVWKTKKNDVIDLYKNNECPYGFIGEDYMILAGHTRAYSHVQLFAATNDIKYTKIDAIVKEKLTFEQAQYIIKVTNFINRENSAKSKREDVKWLYGTLSKNKTKGMNIAQKIADDTGSKLRTVQYYMSINKNLIPEFIQMFDDDIITQGNAVKLTSLTKSLQLYMYSMYGDKINNKTLKGLQKSYDRESQIDNMFSDKSYSEYVTITTDIPKELEKKFRKAIENWKSKNL